MERIANYSIEKKSSECGVNWQRPDGQIGCIAVFLDEIQNADAGRLFTNEFEVDTTVAAMTMPEEIKAKLIKNFIDNMGI